MGWRDQKRVARRIVHETMALPCWRIPFAGGVPTVVRGRLHAARPTPQTSAMGDLDSQGFARWEETHTKIVFMRDEVDAKRSDVFVFGPDEAYTVHPERPFDDETMTVKVSRLEKNELDILLATISPALVFWPDSDPISGTLPPNPVVWGRENMLTTARKYSNVIGDGVSATLTVIHNLNSQDIVLSVRDAVSGEAVLCDWRPSGPNSVELTFAAEHIPAVGQYRVTIAG